MSYLTNITNGDKFAAEAKKRGHELPSTEKRAAELSLGGLRELRSKIKATTKDMLDNWSERDDAALSIAHDAGLNLMEEVAEEIELRERAGGFDAPRENSLRPGGRDIEVRGHDDGDGNNLVGRGVRGRGGWSDDRGQSVRVLAPNENLAPETRQAGPGFGDIVRALHTGPRNDLERRALAEGSGPAGGYTVATPLATWFIDRLRGQSVCIAAGARTVEMTSDSLAIARLATDPLASWVEENALVPTSDATFSRVQFNAQKLIVLVKVSRELLEDSVNAGDMIDQAFAQSMALELDRVALSGSGASPEPLGIINTPGINSISLGANGGVPTQHDFLVDAVYEVLLDQGGPITAAVWHPRTWKTLSKLKDGQGNYLTRFHPEEIENARRLVTPALPINEVQGTANNTSSAIVGNFAHLMIGIRKNLEIRKYDGPYIANDQIAFVARLRADVQLSQPEAFCRIRGIKDA